MALLYQMNWRLPERRVDLYDECVKLLLAKWDCVRGVDRRPRFAISTKRKALVALATHLHETGTLVASEETVRDIFEHNQGASEKDGESVSDLRDEIMEHSGLVRRKSRSSFDFLHRTFQEFFAAWGYHERGLTETVLAHSDEPWWQEVIRLYAALQEDATSFLERLRGEHLYLAAGCLADCKPRDTETFDRIASAIVADLEGVIFGSPNQRQVAADVMAEIGGWGTNAFLTALATDGTQKPEISVAAVLALSRANDSVFKSLLMDLGAVLRLLHGQLLVFAPALRGRILLALERIGYPLVYVPAGSFLMGESRTHDVKVSEYWIDKFPVTNAQYSNFLRETGHEPEFGEYIGPLERWSRRMMLLLTAVSLSGKEQHPVVNVTWEDAYAYGRWCGKRLPTEAEWEKAARGTDGRNYPWGNQWGGNRCNVSSFGTTPVGKYPLGVSPYGCHDMAGNVLEWVADRYARDYYVFSPGSDPQGPRSGTKRGQRGGCWCFGPGCARCTTRSGLKPNIFTFYGGFRTVCSSLLGPTDFVWRWPEGDH
jgi:sulfatase modifying factor 1